MDKREWETEQWTGESEELYETGLYRIDAVIEQLKEGLGILREINQACLEKLQDLHPEWRYSLQASGEEYRILDGDTGRLFQYKRALPAIQKLRELNGRSVERPGRLEKMRDKNMSPGMQRGLGR